MESPTKPSVCVRRVRKPRASRLGRYPSFLAVATTRSLVSVRTWVLGVLLSTCDTVVTDTPAAAATSRIPVRLGLSLIVVIRSPWWCSSLDRTEGEAGDDVTLEDQGEQDDGDGVQ